MHIAGTIFAVLGAWLVLAVPIALVVGRFLRVGTGPARATTAQQMTADTFGSSAA